MAKALSLDLHIYDHLTPAPISCSGCYHSNLSSRIHWSVWDKSRSAEMAASASSSGGLKFKLKLGSAPSASSTVAPPSSSSSHTTGIGSSLTLQRAAEDDTLSELSTPGPEDVDMGQTTPGQFIGAIGDDSSPAKQPAKRKRKPPGVQGPGKHWRRGLKGNIAKKSNEGGQRIVA